MARWTVLAGSGQGPLVVPFVVWGFWLRAVGGVPGENDACLGMLGSCPGLLISCLKSFDPYLGQLDR